MYRAFFRTSICCAVRSIRSTGRIGMKMVCSSPTRKIIVFESGRLSSTIERDVSIP